MPRSPFAPSYRLHRSSGQAAVTVRTATGERKGVYRGVYNYPESRAECGRSGKPERARPTPYPSLWLFHSRG
jgi:hypothetical protein